MKSIVSALWAFLVSCTAVGSPLDSIRIDPPHWFVGWPAEGHPFHTVELLVEGEALVSVHGTSPFSKVSQDLPAQNERYRYVTVDVHPEAPAHTLELRVTGRDGSERYLPYHFKTRRQGAEGLRTSDVMYLITPDRFANGDTSNDVVLGMAETRVERSTPHARHGGDLAGIRQRRDHLRTLGVTAVWLNPVLENNQPVASYHGYAITDHYRVDPRLGTNEEYCSLVEELHRDSLRIVMDVVLNHMGDRHRLYRNPPDSSWFHWWPRYTNTNFAIRSVIDASIDTAVRDTFLRGWFDRMMPDVDQRSPHVARYLLQNTAWWIMEAGVDALRVDTYPYSYPAFLRWCNISLKAAFPQVGVFGEVWVDNIQDQHAFIGPDHSDLSTCTDFALYHAFEGLLSENADVRADGCRKLGSAICADTLPRARKHVAFADNHDVGRIYGRCRKDLRSWSLLMTVLYTLPRIPCILYGTEFLFSATDDHGLIREDVQGGWIDDHVNLYRAEERTSAQGMACDLLTRLARYRRASTTMAEGTFEWIPSQEGVIAYTYRLASSATVVVANTGDSPITFQLAGVLPAYSAIHDALRTKSLGQMTELVVLPGEARVIDLQ